MIDRALAATFGLILLFLLLTRSQEFSAIVRAIGGFVTEQTRILQGLTPTGFSGEPSYSLVR